MTDKINCTWEKRYLLGKVAGKNIYLSAPKWDCGWYWSFGYLGNSNCHYHLDGLGNRNQNMRDAIIEHFDTNTLEIKELWLFCELASTAYALKQTAEILGRGGSYYTTNPLADIIKNADEVKRINEILLPSIFNEIEKAIKGE